MRLDLARSRSVYPIHGRRPSSTTNEGVREFAVFGAPVDTGNLGVSALAIATLAGIVDRNRNAHVTLFDFTPGAGPASLNTPSGRIAYTRRGAYRSRRFHRPENLRSMYAAAHFTPALNPNVRVIDRADAVLDVSGGDSFTDLYGRRRFALITLPKRIALQRHRPLHLLPQTFGPFQTRSSRALAEAIVRGAETAWARDPRSYDILLDLLGPRFDSEKHRRGVDMAFLLPRATLPVEVADRLTPSTSDERIVGINVSGLLSNVPDSARERFRLAADYPLAMERLIRRFVETTDVRVVLVPHVSGQRESDHVASERLREIVAAEPRRVMSLPRGLDAMQTKSVIASCEWFLGARMHSTIAALSQSIPAAAVGYSDKTAGVFATCKVQDEVVDARKHTTEDLVDALWERWERRTTVRRTLATSVPEVLAAADAQLDRIVGWSDCRRD